MSLELSLQQILEHAVSTGLERGLQAVVYHRGKVVAECEAGSTDPTGEEPVTSSTLFPVFSTTKGITATVIHQLVERGKLTYDTTIAEIWPDFAAHGKDGITLRHVLNHTSGLPNMPVDITEADLYAWDRICAAVARLAPLSPPGQTCAYHAITYGYLLGEAAHRVDGRPFGEIVSDEIARPLGLEDEMFVGIPDEVAPRVALLEMKMDAAGAEQQRRDPALSPIVVAVAGLDEPAGGAAVLFARLQRNHVRASRREALCFSLARRGRRRGTPAFRAGETCGRAAVHPWKPAGRPAHGQASRLRKYRLLAHGLRSCGIRWVTRFCGSGLWPRIGIYPEQVRLRRDA